VCGSTTPLAKGTLRPLLDTPAYGAVEASSLPSTIQSYRRLIPHQRRRMTSPLRHLPMSERAAVRSQTRRASKLPRYPHGHVMETLSVDALSGTPSVGRCHRDREGSFRAALPWNHPIDQRAVAPFGNLDQPRRLDVENIGSLRPVHHPEKSVGSLHQSLSGCAHNGYTFRMSGKDSGFRIRVERDLRDKFVETCRTQDRPAAQVMRDFMRQYIRDHDDKRPKAQKQ
jgi:hypothetical protein